MKLYRYFLPSALIAGMILALFIGPARANNSEYIKASGNKFVGATSGTTFVPWGMDGVGSDTSWATPEGQASILADMTYEQSLGINVVRFGPQFGSIIDSYTPGTPPTFGTNAINLALLQDYIEMADSLNMRVDLTGLGVLVPGLAPYDPSWYDGLSTANRWAAQAAYWQAVSTAVNASAPKAVFCYDLENEPLSPYSTSGGTESSWYQDEWNQFITESIATTQALAETEAANWTEYITSNIQHSSGSYVGDTTHLITVGALPLDPSLQFGNFAPSYISPYLSFMTTHIYPGATAAAAISDMNNSAVSGKPLLVEETLDQSCPISVESQFILGSSVANDGSDGAAGWITHFADTVSDYNILATGGNLNDQVGIVNDLYVLMEYLFLSPDFGFAYPNLAAQVATPTFTPSLASTSTGGTIEHGLCFITPTYTWNSGLDQTTVDTNSGYVNLSSTNTSTITAPAVMLPSGATGLKWYAANASTGPWYLQGTATVTSGVAAAYTMDSVNTTSGTEAPAYPACMQWNPTGSPWTFSTPYNSGIATYTGTYANGLEIPDPYGGNEPGCPGGDQTGFITGTGSVSESVYFQKGVQYTISFSAGQCTSNTSNETFYVDFASSNIGGTLYSPANNGLYTQYTTSNFNTNGGASGYYTISFKGQATYTALIDNVIISPQSPDLNFECPTLNPSPNFYGGPNGGGPAGTSSTTGGSLPAGSYYISCTYTWNSGASQTTGSPTSAAIVTTGTTSSITTQAITSGIPSNVTGVNWYAANSATGTQYLQGAVAISAGAAPAFTITSLATTTAAPSSAIGYLWDPTGANWTFTSPSGNNGSGISTSGTTYTGSVAVPLPEVQTGMLKGEGTISQSIYLQSGVNYTLNFAAAQMSGNASNETFTVDVDGTAVGTAFNVSGTSYSWEATSTTFSVATSGNHTLSFVGTNSAAVMAFINNVQISPYPNL